MDDAVDAADSVVDPAGAGPRIWFQQVPETKVVKNRLHLDLRRGGGRTVSLAERRERVLAEEARLVEAGAIRLRLHDPEDVDHFRRRRQRVLHQLIPHPS